MTYILYNAAYQHTNVLQKNENMFFYCLVKMDYVTAPLDFQACDLLES